MTKLFKKYLIEIGLTQKEYAKKLGLSETAINLYITNKRFIPIRLFHLIRGEMIANECEEYAEEFTKLYILKLRHKYKNILEIIDNN